MPAPPGKRCHRPPIPSVADGTDAATSDNVVVGKTLFCTASDSVATSDKAEVEVFLTDDFPVLVAIAQRAYDNRDFASLPLLADVLEDAGCTDAVLLGHLRAKGPHVRGCFAVDAVLGRS